MAAAAKKDKIMCEFCGESQTCGVCGRGYKISSWDVIHKRSAKVTFTTRRKWVARLFCWFFMGHDYAPKGWGVID